MDHKLNRMRDEAYGKGYTDGRASIPVLPRSPRYVSRDTGKGVSILSHDHDVVSFKWDGGEVTRYLGAEEFDRRFRPEGEISPAPVSKKRVTVAYAHCCSGSVRYCDCVNKNHGTALMGANEAGEDYPVISPAPEPNVRGWEDEYIALSDEQRGMLQQLADHFGVPLIAAFYRAKELGKLETPSPQTKEETSDLREKLAICIRALRLISGDPALDEEIKRLTGEPLSAAQVKARTALAAIGASTEAEANGKEQ